MRFVRQTSLSDIGESGQKVFADSHVVVVGCGALGHPVVQYLAAAGVGRVTVVDGDRVDESNLQRQVLFTDGDVGRFKAEVVHERISRRGDPVQIEFRNEFVTQALALELFQTADLAVDCTDNFSAKFLINDICLSLAKPMVFGSVAQFEGQLSVFWPGQGPCYRCLVGERPKAKIQNCAQDGVLGAIPGTIGSLQALEALKVLLRLKGLGLRLQPLVGQLQVFDFAESSSWRLSIPIRQNCRCQGGPSKVHSHESETGVIVDVREADELLRYSVPSFRQWPLSRIESGDFPEDLREVSFTTICVSGARAERAAQILMNKGFLKVQFSREGVYGYQTR